MPPQNVQHPKAFALAFLASLGTLLLGLIVVNWLGNGREMYPSPWHPTITERAWKTRRLVEAVQRGTPPQVLILGSSRMMEIQPEYVRAITGKRTFNYAVGSATPVDYLAQLRFALRVKAKPEMAILGVDEFVFCESSTSDVRLLGDGGLFAEVPFPENVNILGRSLASIGIGDTVRSILNLARLGRRRVRGLGEVDDILVEDGYLVRFGDEMKKAAKKYDFSQALEHSVAYYNDAYGIGTLGHCCTNLSLRRVVLFREFLDLAQAHGIDLHVMLLPVHPAFEQKIFSPELQDVRRKVDKFLQNCCQERGIPYRNFTKLESYSGDPNEFWDGTHQTAANLCRMINVLFGLPPLKAVVKLPTNLEIIHHLPAVTTLNAL